MRRTREALGEAEHHRGVVGPLPGLQVERAPPTMSVIGVKLPGAVNSSVVRARRPCGRDCAQVAVERRYRHAISLVRFTEERGIVLESPRHRRRSVMLARGDPGQTCTIS